MQVCVHKQAHIYWSMEWPKWTPRVRKSCIHFNPLDLTSWNKWETTLGFPVCDWVCRLILILSLSPYAGYILRLTTGLLIRCTLISAIIHAITLPFNGNGPPVRTREERGCWGENKVPQCIEEKNGERFRTSMQLHGNRGIGSCIRADSPVLGLLLGVDSPWASPQVVHSATITKKHGTARRTLARAIRTIIL